VSGTDPVSIGPAILAGHRAVGTLLQVDPARTASPAGDAEVAVMPLAGAGILVTALAHDAVTLRQRLTWAQSTGTSPRRN
jgi:urease accessory protein